ncbi:hypothetical protein A5886_000687 [Enterococcus sp. 8G7_MSG3316]|uniref:DUF3284 domain-containing protein n=1 Tax=Candidatus Enterococcus testudinis TaxID=1834191 RepID=A0A242A3T5_9ENTE|nr:DUF3284 domain-containing protein [Enterococcus sp. 8G7_MSG3316]OTN75612.1 hypothetical protein A5886_000687 [Enterococcus sp. 8G7_MSG3316]
MKLKRVLPIEENEFYNYLESELLNDSSHTNTSVNKIEKGMTYSKIEPKTHLQINVLVKDYQRGHVYEVAIDSLYEKLTIKYQTKPTKEGLQIVFEQHIASFQESKQNRWLKWFSEGVYLGRMSDTLFDIQKKIEKSRVISS